MPLPLAVAAPLIGGAIGAVGSIFGGGPDDALNDDSRQFFNENIRGMGGAAANAATGFDPASGQFGMPSGPFAGPLAEGFDMESVNRFANPFMEQAAGVLRSDRDRALLMNQRRASEMAAKSGSSRGSRRSVFEQEGATGVQDAFMRNLVNMQLGGFRESAQTALQAQPFRDQALDANQMMRRTQFGMDAANFGLGPREAFMNPEFLGGQPQQNPISGFLGGAIAGMGFGGGGGGSTAAPGMIPSINPPQMLPPMPGPNLTPNPMQLPPQLGLPPIG